MRAKKKEWVKPVDRPNRPQAWAYRHLVCIPSAGRPEVLAKTLRTQPFLNNASTFIGVDNREAKAYQDMLRVFGANVRLVTYDNPLGSIAVCREALRKAAIEAIPIGQLHKFWIVVTDDNAVYTDTSLKALIATARAWREKPCIVAGMHGTAKHFDRHRLSEMEVCNGYPSYPQVAMIFQVYPATLYAEYSYPPDVYGLDDRHLAFWAIAKKGLRRSQFRVAMNAPYRKSRYQAGGQGDMRARARKTGLAIARCALDFPELVGTRGTLPTPWQVIFALAEGKHVDRLASGSMRREDALITSRSK